MGGWWENSVAVNVLCRHVKKLKLKILSKKLQSQEALKISGDLKYMDCLLASCACQDGDIQKFPNLGNVPYTYLKSHI